MSASIVACIYYHQLEYHSAHAQTSRTKSRLFFTSSTPGPHSLFHRHKGYSSEKWPFSAAIEKSQETIGPAMAVVLTEELVLRFFK